MLLTPRSDMTWLFPAIAAVGALGLLVVAGRRWVARGSQVSPPGGVAGSASVAAASASASTKTSDEEYADKLDDELAETD